MRPRQHLLGLMIAVVAVLVLAPTPAAHGQEPGTAERLAERYAPIVVTRDQSRACDRDGEPYRPVPVETVLGRPEIALRDPAGEVLVTGPTATDLVGRGPQTSLDFPGNPRRPGCRYERDFRSLGADAPTVAYAHIATDPAAPGRLALQYWFFWYFDDYVNTHEGDWEFIQIVFDAPTARAALEASPRETGYSQHSGGETADWEGDKLERAGDHPVVYAAAGSHANYYTADLFLGRSATEGFGCDNTRGPGTRHRVAVRLLPSGTVDPAGPARWLLYEGRWGERQPGPYGAPAGPLTKGPWREPIAWQASVREGSVAVPSGATLGPTATGAFCAAVHAGGRVYTAVTSPTALLLIILGLVGTAGLAVRSTSWSPRVVHPLRRARDSGQVLRAAWGTYRAHLPVMLAVGALFLPAAALGIGLQALLVELTPMGHLVALVGDRSLASAALALLMAGAGHALAATVVVGGAALVLQAADAGRPPTVRIFRRLGGRVWSLLGASILVELAVLLLALTVVGIPLVVLLLGRWAVAAQVVAIEGRSPRAALRRSRQLTAGRWWWTARLAASVNVIGAASGPVVGIVLLFVAPVPLATVNVVSSAVFVAVLPLVGAALAFLYGNLVARSEEPVSARRAPDRRRGFSWRL